jgi:hypothetical protein
VILSIKLRKCDKYHDIETFVASSWYLKNQVSGVMVDPKPERN